MWGPPQDAAGPEARTLRNGSDTRSHVCARGGASVTRARKASNSIRAGNTTTWRTLPPC